MAEEFTFDQRETIRRWNVDQVHGIVANNEQWNRRLTRIAAAGDRKLVVDALRDLIEEDPQTAGELLIELLDLSDSRQADLFLDLWK